jgi:hypothetical protein
MLRKALVRVLEATNSRLEEPLFRGYLQGFCMKQACRGIEER